VHSRSITKDADREGNHRPLQEATKMKPNVFYARNITGEAWQLTTPTIIKDCFMKCDFGLTASVKVMIMLWKLWK
jgi:hypothetical protein